MIKTRTTVLDAVSRVGEEILLKGWVRGRRDMGKIIFIDLRDRSGIMQVICAAPEVVATANQLRSEYAVAIRGLVKERSAKQINEKLPSGRVEVEALEVIIINPAKTPPFELDKDTRFVNEETRLRYRYLDLRSERMLKNLELRHRVIKFFRDFLSDRGFLEVETPILTKGTPEGAREFIVPSRLHAGKAYVLPQSPQQFKQLLMVAGVEKYFQVAKAFRDEDQRGDRQPEFTQLDIEMSFVEQEDILKLGEEMMNALIDALNDAGGGYRVSKNPWPRLTYAEAMEKYKTDKPDLREDKNNPKELAFAWVVDFPMYEQDAEGALAAAHHPFTRPHSEDEHLLELDPLKVRARSYDIVLNGYEISSGSIRIHERELQNRIFKILGLSQEEINAKFGHMLEAFEYGAPPHGGFAPGLDRLVMILADEPNIREVMAFPKTGDARDPMMGSPSLIGAKQMKDAHIKWT
ncbi:aspartate--tRNA ligase [Candidatus Uhrbacteria bacterium]|nr:aspartate--tRNA ligase [Candidatus Uhrbacteria bacterium]